MKITNDIIKALHQAINTYGNRYQFSLKVKIPQQTIKRWVSGQTASIDDDVWEKLYPHIAPYLSTHEFDARALMKIYVWTKKQQDAFRNRRITFPEYRQYELFNDLQEKILESLLELL